MAAVGIFDRVEVSSDHTGMVKVRLEMSVPNEHFMGWQELMSENPRMVRLNSINDLPVKLPKTKPQNDPISGSNPAAGSW